MDSTVTRITQFLTIGGPVVWVLLGFSFIAVTIVIVKLWQIATLRVERRKPLDRALEVWKRQESQNAIAMLDQARPVENIVAFTMLSLWQGNRDVMSIREEAERRALNLLNELRSYLRPLEVMASLAPLLGLLGTVLGMITAFQQMESAGSQVDPSMLSGGIWQALLTTAVGIMVAMPLVMMHAWLERKVERVAHTINDVVTQVFTSKEGVRLAALAPSGEALHAA
jgi:biopolymer transport protein ExbB